jgi:hypothetical protein
MIQNFDRDMEIYRMAELVKEAFICGYPMLDMYSILYRYAVDKSSP